MATKENPKSYHWTAARKASSLWAKRSLTKTVMKKKKMMKKKMKKMKTTGKSRLG